MVERSVRSPGAQCLGEQGRHGAGCTHQQQHVPHKNPKGQVILIWQLRAPVPGLRH